MGLFGWLAEKRRRSRIDRVAHETGLALAWAVFDWCSPEEVAGVRQILELPPDARGFEEEIFYLYVFLVSTSILMSYDRGSPVQKEISTSFWVEITIRIRDHKASPGVSMDALKRRWDGYFAGLQEFGAEYYVERLPYAFLLSNGICPSESRADIVPGGRCVRATETWIGGFLKQLKSRNDEWKRLHFG